MSTTLDVLSDWAGVSGPRYNLFSTNEDLILRWLNEAQLRFADRSEVLRGIWEPVLDSSGEATIPEDMLRIVKDKVKWDSDEWLKEADYPTVSVLTLSTTEYYSVWNGTFYVFAAAEGEPIIPYIKKPDTLLKTNYRLSDLEVPTEYHHDLIAFLDAQFARHSGATDAYYSLMADFHNKATLAGIKYAERNDPVPHTISRRF